MSAPYIIKYKSFTSDRIFNSKSFIHKMQLRKESRKFENTYYNYDDLFFLIVICGGDKKKYHKNIKNKEEVYTKWKNQNK